MPTYKVMESVAEIIEFTESKLNGKDFYCFIRPNRTTADLLSNTIETMVYVDKEWGEVLFPFISNEEVLSVISMICANSDLLIKRVSSSIIPDKGSILIKQDKHLATAPNSKELSELYTRLILLDAIKNELKRDTLPLEFFSDIDFYYILSNVLYTSIERKIPSIMVAHEMLHSCKGYTEVHKELVAKLELVCNSVDEIDGQREVLDMDFATRSLYLNSIAGSTRVSNVARLT